MSEDTIILRPAFTPVILMAIIGAPFIVLGIWVGIDASRSGDWTLVTVVSAGGVFLLGSWLSLEIATVRIYLTQDELRLRRFWHTRWSVPRTNVLLEAGRVGDGGFLPGLKVYDVSKRRHIGEILNAQFRPADLERLCEAVQRS